MRNFTGILPVVLFFLYFYTGDLQKHGLQYILFANVGK